MVFFRKLKKMGKNSDRSLVSILTLGVLGTICCNDCINCRMIIILSNIWIWVIYSGDNCYGFRP